MGRIPGLHAHRVHVHASVRPAVASAHHARQRLPGMLTRDRIHNRHRTQPHAQPLPAVGVRVGGSRWHAAMPTPRTPLPFRDAFTTADVHAAGLTHRALAGWLQRGEVVQLGVGTFIRAGAPYMRRMQAIHRTRAITMGERPVSALGAAAVHWLCTPAHLPDHVRQLPRARDLTAAPLERHGRLLVPARAWAALDVARGQELPGALVPLDCYLRNSAHPAARAQLLEAAERMHGWPGTAQVQAALQYASPLSGSALESHSFGLFVDGGLPLPERQTRFVIDGRTHYVDFFWPDFRLIGEADGEMKFDEEGRAQYEAHRRQGRLQKLGIPVVRWGWDEVLRDPQGWLEGLRIMLASQAPRRCA